MPTDTYLYAHRDGRLLIWSRRTRFNYISLVDLIPVIIVYSQFYQSLRFNPVFCTGSSLYKLRPSCMYSDKTDRRHTTPQQTNRDLWPRPKATSYFLLVQNAYFRNRSHSSSTSKVQKWRTMIAKTIRPYVSFL